MPWWKVKARMECCLPLSSLQRHAQRPLYLLSSGHLAPLLPSYSQTTFLAGLLSSGFCFFFLTEMLINQATSPLYPISYALATRRQQLGVFACFWDLTFSVQAAAVRHLHCCLPGWYQLSLDSEDLGKTWPDSGSPQCPRSALRQLPVLAGIKLTHCTPKRCPGNDTG